MTIQKLHLPLKPVSKPRGKVGKGGHIYHQSKEYSTFQKEFDSFMRSCSFSLLIPQSELYGIAINFTMLTGRGGGKNDLDNMAGAVLDALVKYEVISDDNYGVVKRLYSAATTTPHQELTAITIYFVSSKYELLYVIENCLN